MCVVCVHVFCVCGCVVGVLVFVSVCVWRVCMRARVCVCVLFYTVVMLGIAIYFHDIQT